MPTDPWPDAPTVAPTSGGMPPGRSAARGPSASPLRRGDGNTGDQTTAQRPATGREPDPTLVEPPAPKRRFGRWRKSETPTPPPAAPTPAPAPTPDPEEPPARAPDPAMAPPGFHIYRPSSAATGGDEADR